MKEITKVKKGLPDKPEALAEFILIGTEAVRAHEKMLSKLKGAKKTGEYFLNRLKDAWIMADVIIDAMVKLGYKLEATVKKGNKYSSSGGTIPSLPTGITKKLSHIAQVIARHPGIVEDCKKAQRDKKVVMTWNMVYGLIHRKTKEKAEIPLIDGMYKIIYADPPWKYDNTMSERVTEARCYYEDMTLAEICEIDIKNHILENAVLFLWTPWAILEQSFKVISAWGFQYKAGWCWDKVKHNMGYYNSVRSELLLLGVRGSCPLEHKILHDNVVSIERTGHSVKPDYFRNMIDVIYPSGPALEMFYRGDKAELSERWSAVGDEISGKKNPEESLAEVRELM